MVESFFRLVRSAKKFAASKHRRKRDKDIFDDIKSYNRHPMWDSGVGCLLFQKLRPLKEESRGSSAEDLLDDEEMQISKMPWNGVALVPVSSDCAEILMLSRSLFVLEMVVVDRETALSLAALWMSKFSRETIVRYNASYSSQNAKVRKKSHQGGMSEDSEEEEPRRYKYERDASFKEEWENTMSSDGDSKDDLQSIMNEVNARLEKVRLSVKLSVRSEGFEGLGGASALRSSSLKVSDDLQWAADVISTSRKATV